MLLFSLSRPWQRCLAVTLLTIPFAIGLRLILIEVLRPTLAEQAEAYISAKDVRPLSAPLAEILSDFNAPALTQDHSLLHRTAPDFSLPDDRRQPTRLSDLRRKGPVVVVFYYGYYCPHCVAQLFAIDKDMPLFRELGAEVIAISADPCEDTAARFVEFGRFGFPVLSDRDNHVAEAYGLYTRPTADREEDLKHGTFVIAPDGSIEWAYAGPKPFLDNRTLLREAARRTHSRLAQAGSVSANVR
jgi:peroxiredoxin